MNTEKFNINNLSTFAMLIAGFITPILVKYLNLTIDTSVVAGIIVFAIAYISAKYPNELAHFNNAVNTVVNSEAQTEEEIIETNDYEVLDEEAEC